MKETKYRRFQTLCLCAILTSLFGCGMFDGKSANDDASARPSDSDLVLSKNDSYVSTFDPDLRRRAVARIAASSIGGEAKYVAAYRILLRDDDPLVQATAARALGSHGQPSDVELLIGMLKYEDQTGKPVQDEIVRWETARALAKLHNADAIGPLLDAMTLDESTDVRASAAFALGQYPRPTVFDTLVNTLNDTDYTVSAAAQRSLYFLTGQDFGDDVDAWNAWSEKHKGKLFEGQLHYTYQAYGRDRDWYHFLPFVETPPKDGKTLPPKGFKLGT